MGERARFELRRTGGVAVVAAALLLALLPAASSAAPDGQGGGPPDRAAPGQPSGGTPDHALDIEVLSSPPEFVSGGDARLLVHLPEGTDPEAVEVTLDDDDVTGAFTPTDDGDLEGVVDGLPEGESEVMARIAPDRARGAGSQQGGRRTTLTLTNHPSSGPMFSGPQQQPFGCSTEGDLEATGVDGGPRLHEADQADDCAMDTLVSYLYRPAGASSGFEHYDPEEPPDTEDIARTTTIDGEEIPFIVRWERGTINRFVYSIAIPSPAPDPGDEDEPADLSAWNDRLMYRFQGGVGIGHYQGDPDDERMLDEFGLSDGYAVVYSTGTRTGDHYNLEVGGETAIMVKDRFVTAYDDPRYTVGLGVSGGAIQQYVYGQNHPGLIDAAIPVQSYPDMVTQTTHVGDCELLARWMDQRVISGADDAAQWAQWSNRSLLQGLNAVDTGVTNELAGLMTWMPEDGATECRNAWTGLSALALNPHFGEAPGVDQTAVEWTHFGDAINIYGENPDGFANRTWDNVGVQYGLEALRDGDITPEQFLDLNWEVGSWKNEPEMVQEGCPYLTALCADPDEFDPWSERNMNLATDDAPAPRATADPGAIEAAYRSGLVFRGDIDIPIIDWRPYLERELDMHNAHQSFAARQRMLDHDGDASNQVIWFTQGPELEPPPQVSQALHVMDEWMANIAEQPQQGVAGNRPDGAVDRCFDADGEPIAAGEGVWDGILDDGPEGACAEEFPIYSQSRVKAGGPITGDVFKCELQPVSAAVAQGVYGDWEPDADELATLEEIFPDGVCDYRKGDARRPPDLR
ncbi:MAG: DUF6351 family protein [Nitriliruptoraceae bacterium]